MNINHYRNPTPESSPLPKWDTTTAFPLNYYRIGNSNFEDKPIVGMEHSGLFENRAKFWRQLLSHVPQQLAKKDEL